MMGTLLSVAFVVLPWCTFAYLTVATWFMRVFKIREPWTQWLYLILKWPALPGCWAYVAHDIMTGHAPSGWIVLASVGDTVFWWLVRNDGDDDFRKRLRDRVSGVVKSLGHRLVVAPVPAGSPA
jgi:hypothetical protein